MAAKNETATTESDSIVLSEKDDSKCCCCPCRHGKKVAHNPHYTPHNERSCTNLLCLVFYIVAMIVWIVIGSMAFQYGTPDILNHAMDSHGNICGINGSDTHTVTAADGTAKQVTNKFEYKKGSKGEETGGTAPFNLGKAKYGTFPRLATDLINQADKLSKPKELKFTQICVDKCPEAGDIVCNYFFLAKYEKALKSPNNPVDNKLVRSFMRVTSGVTRAVAQVSPYFLEKACGIYKDDEYDMCLDSFVHCDSTAAPSTPILGRCVPYLKTNPEVETQRCIEPLTDTVCNPADESTWNETGADSDFNTECMLSTDDAKYYKARYIPRAVQNKKYKETVVYDFKLSDEANKYCVRMEKKELQIAEVIPQMQYLSGLTAIAGTIAQYMGDIRTAWYVVLASGLIFPLVFSFVYTLFMRFCAGCMVWLALILFIMLTIALGIVSLLKGGALDISMVDSALAVGGQAAASSYSFTGASEDHGIYYKIIGWVLLAGALICVCLCIFMRKVIASAIHIIKTAATALGANFTLTLFPIISFAGIAATGAVFIVIGILLLTAGNITEQAMGNSTVNSTSAVALALMDANKPQMLESFSLLNYFMIFDLFMFLWTTEFIQAIGVMVIGGTISHWYFATTDGSVKPTKEHHGQSHPCCCAWYIALRFHIGSAAFGSFIIAVVNLIRAAFEYVDHQMKNSGVENRAMKCLRCMIGCCLACLAKCIRFISKNSYIHTSIKGDAFCFAAVRSYRLIFTHLLSFGATNMITEILMVVGKIMVCCASMLFSYSWIQYTPKFSEKTSPDYLSSTLFISIIVLTLAYLVAESFFNVFNVAIDTILMSYCMDLDSPPVGVASRAIVEENMQKLGKSKTQGDAPVADKPGWFSANENKKDGFIARCC